MEYLQLPFEKTSIELAVQSKPEALATVVLAHGAGAGMEHSFMRSLANALHQKGITVVRFNFPYVTEKRKFTGSPIRNIAAWYAVADWAIKHFSTRIYLAGKSYGGRMASHLLAENPNLKVQGVIYFGFPLHAPGKASTERAVHLATIPKSQLFLQGTNDALASIDLMRTVQQRLALTTMVEFKDADHSFKTTGMKLDQVIDMLAAASVSWIMNKSPG